MEETNTLWNKTATELIVKDQLVIMAVVPIIVVGGMAVAGAALTVAEKIGKKFRKAKPALQIVAKEN